jgi:sRNA-binding carbon storage regulator CsrA
MNRIACNRVALAFSTPQDVQIRRSELATFDATGNDEFSRAADLSFLLDTTEAERE